MVGSGLDAGGVEFAEGKGIDHAEEKAVVIEESPEGVEVIGCGVEFAGGGVGEVEADRKGKVGATRSRTGMTPSRMAQRTSSKVSARWTLSQ